MIENSRHSPTSTNGQSQQSSGCAGAIAILLLFIFPPGGIFFLWIKRLWTTAIRLPLTVFAVAWMVLPFWFADDPRHANDRHATDAVSTGVILRETVLYADEATLSTLESEAQQGQGKGTKALKELTSGGKIWKAEFDTKVRVIRRGGPMDALLIEPEFRKHGIKASSAWAMKDSVLPMQHRAARQAMDKSKTISQSTFPKLLGKTNTVLEGEPADLIELVAGIYSGTISHSQAKSFLVLPEAIDDDCAFEAVVGDRLVYEGSLTLRQRYRFALVRDRSFEEGYQRPDDLYDDLKRSGFHSDDPLRNGSLIFLGREPFTARNGAVVSLPVFKLVNVQP